MSVRVNQRKESSVQFIDTARELVVHTIGYTKKFPKSLMFLLTKDIVDTARSIYSDVVIANSCFPNSVESIQFRKNHLMEAKGKLDVLDGLLSIALEMYDNHLIEKSETYTDTDGKQKTKKHGISDYGWVHWGELISKEKSLIKNVINSDNKITF